MSNPLVLFRAGRHLLLGERVDDVRISARYYLESSGWAPVRSDMLTVPASFVVHESFEYDGSLMEAEARSFSDLLHESVLPLVASMRRLDLPSSSLVAYERETHGLGFQGHSGFQWTAMTEALVNEELGSLMALEARKPVLEGLGLYSRADPRRRITEQTHVIQKPLHVYMKETPWRDISKIHEGTEVAVVRYDRGCALIEADSEEFWLPLEEARFVPSKKDDWYYFTLDGDRDGIQDPLDNLPSKVGIGAVVGSAEREDNWNAQQDLPRVAGNFYGYDVPWIPNTDYAILYPEDYPITSVDTALSAVIHGDDVNKVADRLLSS